ncbi:alpha/beta hydrolase [Litchfieldella xinjiangensis]|uniref:alpha/beta hydrolase n=1 Tax=Litchfieldella xinjiangensis TaxID=1166948 RepID=UPI0006942F1B|nr:alpha/beta hydrolase-fold protein [Halomonas xinjiangensis]
MPHRRWIAALCLLSGALCSDALLATNADESDLRLASPQTGREYLIQVSLPKAAPPANGYPVLYVLDGNIRFPLLAAARQTLVRQGMAREGVPWVIVGIGYPGVDDLDIDARAEDLTPPAPALSETGDPGGRPQGGGERFLTFIEETLKPAMAERYPLDRQRQALLGHSYGGLFVLDTLLRHPEAFSDYLAISPSIWWNQRYLFEVLDNVSAFPTEEGPPVKRVVIAVGGLEQSARPGEEGSERARRREANAMIDNARAMADALPHALPWVDTHFVLFEGEDHGSVMWPASRFVLERLGIVECRADCQAQAR